MVKKSGKTPALSEGCREIIRGMKAADVRVFSSVTDTYIGPMIAAIAEDRFFNSVRCCSEEEAVAVAAGAALAGRKSVCAFQNAGLFSSGRGVVLAQDFHAPVLMLISHRGNHLDPMYYHTYKGKLTEPLLGSLGVPFAHATSDEPLCDQISRAVHYTLEAGQPFALLLSKGNLT